MNALGNKLYVYGGAPQQGVAPIDRFHTMVFSSSAGVSHSWFLVAGQFFSDMFVLDTETMAWKAAP